MNKQMKGEGNRQTNPFCINTCCSNDCNRSVNHSNAFVSGQIQKKYTFVTFMSGFDDWY